MVTLNNGTTILIAIGLVLFVITLVFGFSQVTLSEAKGAILGDGDSEGIMNCNPTESSDDCPGQLPAGETEESSWKLQEKERRTVQL